MEKPTDTCPVTRIRAGCAEAAEDEVIREEPLEILVGEKPFAVVMRTPGDEVALAAGLLYAEGIVSRKSDLEAIEYCGDENGNRVIARLTPGVADAHRDALCRSVFLSKSSCGLCGKEMIEEISRKTRACTRQVEIAVGELRALKDDLSCAQEVYAACHGSHAVALFDGERCSVAFAEDIGRHNAMDKAIGVALLTRRLDEVVIAIASSRASFEMVQKAAAAGIPLLATISNPSALAIALAERVGMTLVRLRREDEVRVYTHPERIRTAR